MDREGFRNRLRQYKEAKGFDPQLKYWEWKQKYDSAPQPDEMPSQPQQNQPTVTPQPLDDRAHRWDSGYVQTNRQSFDSPYDDARYYDYRKPRFELRKGDVHYGNPTLLKFMGRFGKVLRGGSLLGETVQNLFPSEEAELIEDLRVKMDKQNKWLTGQEDIPKYDEGGEVGDGFMNQFGKQVAYKQKETSVLADIKNWWNDLTGMKNYAYGNCAITPDGKPTTQCAHYSNAILRKQGYKNITGDAWNRASYSGMKKITSGYDKLTKPTKYTDSAAHEYLQSAADNFINKIDTTALKPYDVIGLYYPDSPNTQKAFENGAWGETQTHTGHITVGKDGTHYVVHNVDGNLKMNKLSDMLTGDYEYLPVSAYRPRK